MIRGNLGLTEDFALDGDKRITPDFPYSWIYLGAQAQGSV